MVLLYLSIPFMLVGVLIALVPLLWAMRQEIRHERTAQAQPADEDLIKRPVDGRASLAA